MPFVTKNFTVDQGATFTFDIIWKDSNDQVIDLTGYSAKMQVRDQAGGKQLAFTLTHTDGIAINGPLGKLVVTISAERTNKMIYPKSYYDILLTAPDNVTKTRILEGTLTLNRAVTV